VTDPAAAAAWEAHLAAVREQFLADMQQLQQQSPEELSRKEAVWDKEQQQYEERQQQRQQDMQQSLFTMVEAGPFEVMFLNQQVAGRLLDMLESWGSEDEEERYATGKEAILCLLSGGNCCAHEAAECTIVGMGLFEAVL
jgi:DNA anti-recombination protein RmuC